MTATVALFAVLGSWMVLRPQNVTAVAAPPPTSTALDQLKLYDEPDLAKAEEVRASTIQEAANLLLTSSAGKHALLQSGTGTNASGGRRHVCVVYEVDPELAEWRPLNMIDAAPDYLKDDTNPPATFFYSTMELNPETPTQQYACWIDAVKPNQPTVQITYLSLLGDQKVLVENADPAGFAPVPSDAKLPLELQLGS